MSTSNTDAISDQYGWFGDDYAWVNTISADLAAGLADFEQDNESRAALIADLYVDPGLPSVGFSLGGATGDEVAALYLPLVVPLIPQGDAVAAALCGLLATTLVALGESESGAIVTALNLRSSQGPALQGGPGYPNPFPGS